MFELLVFVLFVWLFVKAMRLTFHVTWGLAKVIAVILFVLSIPTLIGCLLFAGGLALLAPLALVGIALGLLRACI